MPLHVPGYAAIALAYEEEGGHRMGSWDPLREFAMDLRASFLEGRPC